MPDLAQLNIEILSKEVDTANRRLDELEDRAKKAEKEVKDLGKEAKKTDKSMDGLSRSSKKSARQLKAAVAAAAAFLALRKQIELVRQFEKGLVAVGKTSDITGKDLDALGKRILEISLVSPVATTELLAIAQAAGQLGVEGSDNIIRFTETVAKLGGASDLAGEQAATTLARILTVTGEDISTVDRLASVIVRLGNNAAASESEIARITTRVSQATSIFDVSSRQAAALAATYASIGTTSSELAGSATGRLLRRFNDITQQAGEELELLETLVGITGEEFQEVFEKDAIEALQIFLEALNRTGTQAPQILRGLGLNDQEILNTIPNLAKNYELLEEALQAANEEYELNTALNKEADAANKTLDADIKRFINTVETLAITYDGLSGPLGELLNQTSEFLIVTFELTEGIDDLNSKGAEIGNWVKENLIDVPKLVEAWREFAFITGLSSNIPDANARRSSSGSTSNPTGVGLDFAQETDLGTTTIRPPDATIQDRLEKQQRLLKELSQEYSVLSSQIVSNTEFTTEGLDESDRRFESDIENLRKTQEQLRAYDQLVQDVQDNLAKDGLLPDEVTEQELQAFRQVQMQILEVQKLLDEGRAKQEKDLADQLAQAQLVEEQAGNVGNAFADSISAAIIESEKFSDILKLLVLEIQKVLLEITVLNTVRTATSNIAQTLLGGALGLVGGAVTNAATPVITQGGPTVNPGLGGGVQSFGVNTLANALGNVFSSGRVVPFANGGIFDSPTFFPMRGNQTGLLGEAGPEAIVPLTRMPNGRVGVESRGSNQPVINQNTTNVTQNIKTNDAESFGRSQRQIQRRAKRTLG